jgi:Mrp family chromosome partitioning ATPase
MSTLDQAFIRAYQADAARRTHVAGPAVGASPTEAPAAATQPSASRERRHYVDEPHAASFAPHYADGGAPAHTAGEPIVHQARELAARLAKLNAAAATSQESSSATNDFETGAARDDGLTTAAQTYGANAPLLAAFETQRFQWPRKVEVLVASAGSEFAAFADELEERSRADRKTLLVTGIAREEGRTTLVLALARLAGNRGLRTVVVDLDMQGPQLAEQLGIRPELGWDDAQAERLTLDEVLVESLDDHVTLLPLRTGYANPRALAGTGFLRDAIDRLRAEFDLVLLDVGPLSDDGDTIDLAAALGGCVLDDALVVRDRRRVTPQQLHDACRRTAALGVRRWDIVENFSEIQGY